jgi:hypothetical protein
VYFQLVKELIIWEKCQKNMIEGTTKREQKINVCHSTILLGILFHKCFPLEEAKSQEKKKQVK